MALGIPLPGSFGTAFTEGASTANNIMDTMMKNKMQKRQLDNEEADRPSQIKLRQAQAAQAEMKAQELQQTMDIMSKLAKGENIFAQGQQGGQPSGQPGVPGQGGPVPEGQGHGQQQQNKQTDPSAVPGEVSATSPPQQQMSPDERFRRASILHGFTKDRFGKMDTKEIDGTLFAVTPFDTPIPLIKGSTPLQKALAPEQAKIVGEWDKSLTDYHQKVRPIMKNVESVLSSPGFASIKENPELLGYDMAFYLKGAGTAEQQKAASALSLNLNMLRQQMLQNFKGAAREWENSIVDKAKIDEKDPLNVVYAKYSELRKLQKLESDLTSTAESLVMHGGKTPSEAMAMAEKVVGYDKVRAEIDKEVEQMQKSAGVNQDKPASNVKKYNFTADQLEKFAADARADNKSEEFINNRMKQLTGGS